MVFGIFGYLVLVSITAFLMKKFGDIPNEAEQFSTWGWDEYMPYLFAMICQIGLLYAFCKIGTGLADD